MTIPLSRDAQLHVARKLDRRLRRWALSYQAGGSEAVEVAALYDRDADQFADHRRSFDGDMTDDPVTAAAARIDLGSGDPREAEAVALRIGLAIEGAELRGRGGAEEEQLVWLRPALELARRTGLRGAEHALLIRLGNLHGARSGPVPELYRASLAVARRLGDPRARFESYNGLAAHAYAQRRYPAAAWLYTRALVAARAAGDERLQARVLLSLAGLEVHQRRFAGAGRRLACAERLLADSPWPSLQADLHRGIGLLRQAQGDLNGAAGAFAHQLDLGQRLGDLSVQASAQAHLGAVAFREHRLDDAAAAFTAAARAARACGNVRLYANALGNAAQLAATRGDLDQALAHHEAALPLFAQVDDVRGLAEQLIIGARIHCLRAQQPGTTTLDRQAELATARDLTLQAESLHQRPGMPNVQHHLREILRDLDELAPD